MPKRCRKDERHMKTYVLLYGLMFDVGGLFFCIKVKNEYYMHKNVKSGVTMSLEKFCYRDYTDRVLKNNPIHIIKENKYG